MQKKLRLSLAFLALFSSCALFSQSGIPAHWQPGMTLTLEYGGGMMYYSYKLQISDTGSYYLENVQGKETRHRLEISAGERDSILACLRKYRFDRIKTVMAGPMHDKGTETLALTWGSHSISAGESYMTLIAEKDRERYDLIQGFLLQFRRTSEPDSLP